MSTLAGREFFKLLILILLVGVLLWFQLLQPSVKLPQGRSSIGLLRDQPIKIATVDELNEPWSYKEFMFGPKVHRVPGIIVRLPDPIAQAMNQANPYGAFSRICPQDRCVLQWESPHLKCPCDQSIFSLEPASKSLKRFYFKIEAGDIFITDVEN